MENNSIFTGEKRLSTEAKKPTIIDETIFSRARFDRIKGFVVLKSIYENEKTKVFFNGFIYLFNSGTKEVFYKGSKCGSFQIIGSYIYATWHPEYYGEYSHETQKIALSQTQLIH